MIEEETLEDQYEEDPDDEIWDEGADNEENNTREQFN